MSYCFIKISVVHHLYDDIFVGKETDVEDAVKLLKEYNQIFLRNEYIKISRCNENL